jgi:hypothetical protein
VLLRGALLLALALPGLLPAQTERIRLRALPSSELTVRMAVDQTLRFDLLSAALPSPLTLEGSTTMRFTQKTERPDSAGMVNAHLTYDSLQIVMTLNGSSMGPSGSEMAGKTITAKYDSTGKLVDLVVPADLERLATPMRSILSSALGALPSGEMAQGDSATVTMAVPVPIDLPGASNAPSVTWVTRYRLDRVHHDGEDLIAVFDLLSQGTMKQPVTTPMGTADVDLKMTGTGTMEVDVRRALVRSSTIDTRLNMNMDMGGGSTMNLSGTTRAVTKGALVQ